MKKYMVFKNTNSRPIGLPKEVNHQAEADAALESIPPRCCTHGIYTKEWLISNKYFVEEDFNMGDD